MVLGMELLCQLSLCDLRCRCSNVNVVPIYIYSLQKLMAYFNQTIWLAQLQLHYNYIMLINTSAVHLLCVYLPPKAYWFCFMDYSIVRTRERFVGMYTLRLGV